MGVPEDNRGSTANSRLRNQIGKDASYSPGLSKPQAGHVMSSKPPELGRGKRLTTHHVPKRKVLRG